MAEKQLVIVIDGTAAMGPYWHTIFKDYLEKIIGYFCGNDSTVQEPPGAIVELGLVMFNTHGPHSACLVQPSGWTRDMDMFLQWLSAVTFSGGGSNEAGIAEGLSDALMMFPMHPNGSQTQKDVQRHCILVAASNPFPLPTPVYLPKTQDSESGEKSDVRTECRLLDAETVAKAFTQCFVSLSVISPKQLPKLRAIYDAGNCNAQATDPFVNSAKNPQFLVLLSENFVEARAALDQQEITSSPSLQSLVKMETDLVTQDLEPIIPIFFSEEEIMMLQKIINEPIITEQKSPAENIPTATVKVEPDTTTSKELEPAFPQHPYVPPGTSKSVSSLQTSFPSFTSQEIIDCDDDVKEELKPGGIVLSQNAQLMNLAAVNASTLGNLTQASQVPSSTTITGGSPSRIRTMGSGRQSHHRTMFSPIITPEALVGIPQCAQNTTDGSFISSSSNITGNYKFSQAAGLRRMGSGNQSPYYSMWSPIVKTTGSFASTSSSISGNLRNPQPLANFQGSPGSMSQGNFSGANMEQDKFGLKRNFKDAFGQPGISSGVGTDPIAGMAQQLHGGMESFDVTNTLGTYTMSQQTPRTLQEGQNGYVKAWEGTLTAQIHGQIMLVSRLVAYKMASASEMITANWPETLHLGRLISQDFINNLPYDGPVDYLVVEAINNHRIFEQLQEKRLCANIRLPSQTLILSASSKDCRFIGTLFPGDFPLFRSQLSGLQQHPQQQPQQNQLQQMQGKGMNQT